MTAFDFYFAALFVFLFVALGWVAVVNGPPAGERLKVWLPVLLFAVTSVAAVWAASWLLLGYSRFHTLFVAVVMAVLRRHYFGPVTVADGAALFALFANVIFVICLPFRTRQVQRRSDRAMESAIAQWHQENKPPV